MKKQNFYGCVIIFSISFIIISFLSSFSPSEWNYGFYHLRYFPIIFRIILTTIFTSIIFIIHKKKKTLANIKISKIIPNLISNKKIIFIFTSIVFFVLFWNFRTQVIYGDGFDIIRNFHNDSINITSPLTFIILHLFYYITKKIGLNVFLTIGLSSTISGIIFVYLSLLLSDKLFKEKTKKILFFGLLLSIGSTQLFFGHIEYTSWLPTGIIFYIFLSCKYIKNEISITLPSIAFIIIFLLHMNAIFLFPSLLWLIFYKRKNILKQIIKSSTPIIIILLVFAFYVFVIEWNYNIPADPRDSFGRIGYNGLTGLFYPLKITNPKEQPATMFSLYHLNQIINELLLICPVGLFLLIYFISNKNYIKNKLSVENKEIIIFLTIITIFYLAYTSTGIMAFSGRQDWDTFSSVSIPITLLSNFILLKMYPKKNYLPIALILIALNLFHLLPWILSNHLGLLNSPTSSIMLNV